jgi:hypothetical protein
MQGEENIRSEGRALPISRRQTTVRSDTRHLKLTKVATYPYTTTTTHDRLPRLLNFSVWPKFLDVRKVNYQYHDKSVTVLC